MSTASSARSARPPAFVFIANPNNPTGSLLAQDEVNRLRRELPPEVCCW